MARYERVEPQADEMPVFDGHVDEDDAEEGSRLPLLIIIALLVLAAFAGVVYLAYTQGVERGRADAPRVMVAQGSAGANKQLKIYQQQAPADDVSSEADSAPPPPTPVTQAPAAQAPAVPPSTQSQSTEETPAMQTPAASTQAPPQSPAASAAAEATPKTAPKAASPPAPAAAKIAAATPAAPRVATHAPVQLTPQAPTDTSEASQPSAPAPAEQKVASVETPKPAAAHGGYLLQIGAYKSEEEAAAAWHAYQAKHAMLGGYESNIKQVDLGDKGVWYRLRIGGFAGKDAATGFCDKLKADGGSCFLAK